MEAAALWFILFVMIFFGLMVQTYLSKINDTIKGLPGWKDPDDNLPEKIDPDK